VPAVFKKKGLGKGIGAIIGSDPVDKILEGSGSEAKNEPLDIPLNSIEPNPHQPRENFDEESLRGLADSIKSVGIINPITVEQHGNRFHIITGERRFRAARIAGLLTIPALIRNVDELQNRSMALIENIQREELNAIEEAKAYKILIERFQLKQQDVAAKVGKDRSTITNIMRLLQLPQQIQNELVHKEISHGHARALLALEHESAQLSALKDVMENGLSVRQLEKNIRENRYQERAAREKKESRAKSKDAQIKHLEEELRSVLGTKVEIQHKGKKGTIAIHYYSLEDFDRIRELLIPD